MGKLVSSFRLLIIALFLLQSARLVGAVNPDRLSEDGFVQAYFNMYGDYLSGTKNVTKAELSDVIGYYMTTDDVGKNLHEVGPSSGEMIGSILANSWVDFDCGTCDASVLNQRCCVYRAGEKPMMYECVGSEVKTVSGYEWKSIYECSFGCCNNKCCRDSNPTTTNIQPTTTSTVRSTTTTSSGTTTTNPSTTTTADTTTTGQTTTTTESTTSTTASSGTTSTTTSAATTTTVTAGKFCDDCTPVGECATSMGYRCVDGNPPVLQKDSSCTSASPPNQYCHVSTYECIAVGECSSTPGFRCVAGKGGNPPSFVPDASCTPAGECVTLVNNGDPKDKADIVFIGVGYDNSEMDRFISAVKNSSDGLFRAEPFRSNKNKFNVYYVNKFKASLEYSEDISKDISNCPWTHPVIIGKKEPDDGIYGYCGGYVYLWEHYSDSVIVHEMGHCFGGLEDEYFYEWEAKNCSASMDPGVNCDVAGCPKWVGTPGVGCYQGCGVTCSDWYKPWSDEFENNHYSCVMDYGDEFCPVCTKHLLSVLNKYK